VIRAFRRPFTQRTRQHARRFKRLAWSRPPKLARAAPGAVVSAACGARLHSPASLSRVLKSLIAVNPRAVEVPGTVLWWGGTRHSEAAWMRDQSAGRLTTLVRLYCFRSAVQPESG